MSNSSSNPQPTPQSQLGLGRVMRSSGAAPNEIQQPYEGDQVVPYWSNNQTNVNGSAKVEDNTAKQQVVPDVVEEPANVFSDDYMRGWNDRVIRLAKQIAGARRLPQMLLNSLNQNAVAYTELVANCLGVADNAHRLTWLDEPMRSIPRQDVPDAQLELSANTVIRLVELSESLRIQMARRTREIFVVALRLTKTAGASG